MPPKKRSKPGSSTGGTVGHCALLLIERLGAASTRGEVDAAVAELAGAHVAHWSKDLTAAPDRLGREALSLLVSQRLIEIDTESDAVRLLPAARRFVPRITVASAVDAPQGALW